MSMSLRAGVGALIAGALAVAGLAFAVPTGAETSPAAVGNLTFNYPEGFFQKDSLKVEVDPSAACDSNIVASDVTVLVNSVPTTDDSLVTVVGMGVDARFGLVVHPAAAAALNGINSIGISLSCLSSTTPTVFNGGLIYAQIDITKTVVGAGPAGGQFGVNSTCTRPVALSVGSLEPTTVSETSMDFLLSDGQTGSVFAASFAVGGSCAITETDSLGALTSTVAPGIVTLTSPTRTLVSVTNTFPEATPKFTG